MKVWKCGSVASVEVWQVWQCGMTKTRDCIPLLRFYFIKHFKDSATDQNEMVLVRPAVMSNNVGSNFLDVICLLEAISGFCLSYIVDGLDVLNLGIDLRTEGADSLLYFRHCCH